MTAEELAKLCGGSRRAVHRALTGSPGIAAETRDKILVVAQKHNFVPSSAGQTLRTGRTGLLGFVAGNLLDSYYAHLTMHVVEEALKYGYQVIFSSSEWDAKKEALAFQNVIAQKVDGMIFLPHISSEQRAILPQLIARKFLLVLAYPNEDGFPAVYPDYYQGFTEFVTAQSSERKIGFLMHQSDVKRKAEIFSKVCQEHGIIPEVRIASSWHPENHNAEEYCQLIQSSPDTKLWVISGEISAICTNGLLRSRNHPVQLVALNGVGDFRSQSSDLWALSEELGVKARLLVELAIGKRPFSPGEYLVPMKFLH